MRGSPMSLLQRGVGISRQLASRRPLALHNTSGFQSRQAGSSCGWDFEAMTDLFDQYAIKRYGTKSLNCDDLRALLKNLGETPDDDRIARCFAVADADNNRLIDLDEFLLHAGSFIGDNPASIILVIGGPGSGKGLLSERLVVECNVVHLSSGELLRKEVEQQTSLGKMVEQIMNRGELVSSAIMVALMKKRMENHPGKRVLLDGFPRSLENAYDLVKICGRPELALHLTCDDTILMERIMNRQRGADDNFKVAINRLRTYHKYHPMTMEWLREQHVPVVNLDCCGSPESVWQQLVAMGRLMRPAVKLVPTPESSVAADEPSPLSLEMETSRS